MSSEKLFDEEVRTAERKEELKEGGEARVLTADRRQLMMMTSDLEALLPPDHEARAMWSIVERLDLSKFYEPIAARGGRPGRAALDPKVLLCLWLYATSQGVGSAREVARLCREHDAYRWLCGGLTPNYHKLSDFRVGHEAAVDALLTQILGVLLKQKLVQLKRVAQDGMRVRASAGAASFRRKKSLDEHLEAARRQVEAVKKLAEDPSVTARERAAKERAAKERLERIERALAELPKAQAAKDRKGSKHKKNPEKKEARTSSTDAEARVMKMADGGFRPAYNVQLATDTTSRVIVGVGVTNVGSDGGQMKPMLDDIKERTGSVPEEHLVDGGFVNVEAFEDAKERGVTVYAPVPTPRTEGVDRYAPKPDDSEAVAQWRMRMATDEAKELYKERAATAETVNADLRQWRGLDQFLVRGSKKVTSVVLLIVVTYNVLRWIALTA